MDVAKALTSGVSNDTPISQVPTSLYLYAAMGTTRLLPSTATALDLVSV